MHPNSMFQTFHATTRQARHASTIVMTYITKLSATCHHCVMYAEHTQAALHCLTVHARNCLCMHHARMPAAFQSSQTKLSAYVLSKSCVCRYIGGWPSSPKWMPPGNPSVVDCTCELPRRHNNTYLCLPTWDTHGVCRSHVAGTCIALLTGHIDCVHHVMNQKKLAIHYWPQHTGFISNGQ